MSTHPWSAAYILKRAQCGAPEDLDPVIFKPAELSYQIFSSKYLHTVTQTDRKRNECVILKSSSVSFVHKTISF